MRFYKNYIWRFFCRKNGIAAIEMALIFPVLLIVYIVVYEITLMYSFSKRLTRVASYVGDMIAQETIINQKFLYSFNTFLDATMLPYRLKQKTIAITGYWVDEKNQVKRMWYWPADSGSIKDDIPKSIIDPSTFIVRASVSTKYHMVLETPLLPFTSSDIDMNKVYYYRQRLGDQIECKDCFKR
ncbi:Pilus assembly protein [Candidatus Liberibacter solanacearum]|uniref:TadE/TadG family type IV pilus assembly protein n=1 Tax=Candidatus Liberibacter solanacearum TaxID=556287 RepID=UPI0038729254